MNINPYVYVYVVLYMFVYIHTTFYIEDILSYMLFYLQLFIKLPLWGFFLLVSLLPFYFPILYLRPWYYISTPPCNHNVIFSLLIKACILAYLCFFYKKIIILCTTLLHLSLCNRYRAHLFSWIPTQSLSSCGFRQIIPLLSSCL